MSYYRVARPTAGGRFAGVEVLAVLVLSVALVIAVHASFAQVPVVVDGRTMRVPMGCAVGDLAEDGVIAASPGDLLAASDHRVLVRGGGEPPVLLVDGVPAGPGLRINKPCVVQSVRGQDIVETLETTREPIPFPVLYEGEGSKVRLTATGSVGQRTVVRGSVSGQVVAMYVEERPSAMVFSRERLTMDDRVVALTFDDGPWPGQTEAVLDVLDRYDVKATFFVLGIQVRRNPALLREVLERGHTVGNHTYGHTILRRATKDAVRKEIRACDDAIRRAGGSRTDFFRPPGGILSPSVYEVCADEGKSVVGWTVDPQDWSGKSAEELADEVVAAAQPGAVILLHDGGGDRSATIAALPDIIVRLRARGFQFATLDEVPQLAVGR